MIYVGKFRAETLRGERDGGRGISSGADADTDGNASLEMRRCACRWAAASWARRLFWDKFDFGRCASLIAESREETR